MKVAEYKLADLLITLENGGRPAGGVASITSGIPSVGGEHLTADGGFDFSNVKYVPEEYFQNMRRGHIQADDILIVKDGATTGKTSFVTRDFPFKKAAVNEHVFILRVNKDIVLSKFLFYYLFSPLGQKKVLANYRGAAIGGINQSFTQNTIVPIPPLPEQERIVRLLDEAESLRAACARANARMEQFVPALFQEMFGDPVTNSKKWDIVPVSSFVKEFQAGRSILTDGLETEDTKYWVLKVSAVTWGNYKPHESKPVPKNYQPLPNHFVKAGDLLFSRANTTELVGATVFVFDTPPNHLLSDKLWRFVWKNPDEIEPLFVWSLFQMPTIRYELGQRATGTGGSMKNISQPKVLSMNVPLPPLALQREFAARVGEARGVQSAQVKSAERVEALYQSMLSQAFAGEL